jgi:hypothetical protein
MKIRGGFVSNSSSSSFIICSKDELAEQNIINALGVNEGDPLFGFAKQFAKRVMSAEELDYDSIASESGNFETFEELLEHGKPEGFYYPDEAWDAMVNGHHIYNIWVSSEDLYDDPIGALLYGGFNVSTPEFSVTGQHL